MLLTAVNTLILAITAGIIWWYTRETQKLRRATEETVRLSREDHLFATLTAVHHRLTHSDEWKHRGFLHAEFDLLFERALGMLSHHFQCWQGIQNGLWTRETMKHLWGMEDQIPRFHAALSGPALEAVEHTLLSFDVLSIPVCEGLESARRAADAYRDLIARTAPHILPFVALEGTLRGNKDYQPHYLGMLETLGILKELEHEKNTDKEVVKVRPVIAYIRAQGFTMLLPKRGPGAA